MQWQCNSTTRPRGETPHQEPACFNSLSTALEFTENETGACSGELNVTITFSSTTDVLSTNATFSNGNFSWLSLLGAPSGTVVLCKAAVGLNFDGTDVTSTFMEVKIKRIKFQSCGPGVQSLPAALYFTHHCRIELSDVVVEGSQGSGLVLINILGGVNVSRSNFIGNQFERGYGAGVHMTISFNESEGENILPTNFTDCLFMENSAVPPKNVINPIDELSTKGGGMFVQFRNFTRNTQVVLYNCNFTNNTADWGAGFLGMLDDNVTNNTLTVTATTFLNNHYGVASEKNPYVAGAGAMIILYSNSTSNTAHIHNCTFSENIASWGGGIEFYSKPAPSVKRTADSLNNLIISRCRFTHNVASNGAAVNIYCSSPATSPEVCNAVPLLSDSNFTSNGNLTLISSYNQITASIVTVTNFPAKLQGSLTFVNNYGSPLHVHESMVTIQENASLKFTGNSAQNGGALSLYGSWITVSNNTKLIFINNTAMHMGGAVYAFQGKEAYMPYSHNCFFRYYNSSSEPQEWNTQFKFFGNMASGQPEIMYASSLLPCVWHRNENFTLDQDISATFCSWPNWNLCDSNCTKEIRTSARNFSSTPTKVSMFPGIPNVFIEAVDDFGNKVTNLTINPSVRSGGNTSNEVQYINNSLIVYGDKNTHVNVLLELEGDRNIFMMVNVSLQDCPPGFSFRKTSMSCNCLLNRHIYCEYKPGAHWVAYLYTGYCMSYSLIEQEHKQNWYIVLGRCPFTSGLHSNQDFFSPYLPLPPKAEMLEDEFCGKFNRSGKLCGKCADNYSIDVFSDTFECHNCSGSAQNWLLFLTVEGIPPLIFFITVILLHISVTSGPANGFIFFSQVLTVSLEVITITSSWKQTQVRHPYILSDTMVNLYSIWSLDFFRIVRLFIADYHMCLGVQIKVMHVLVLRYLSAIYSLVFLLIAFLVIELHARNCRVLVWLWKPLCFLCVRFRQTWRAQTSIVDAFAAFILLSYVKMVRISVLLTSLTYIVNINSTVVQKVVNYDPTVVYLSSEHAPFAFIGVFFLLTFGLIPPFLLTFYQFKCFQRCLNRLKLNRNGLRIFMDSFQGCYKDGKDGGPDRRFFAGLYFIFRLVIFTLFDMTNTLSTTYISLLIACILFGITTVLVQPYKKTFYTCLDVFFFNLLAVIMALQLYRVLLLMSDSHSPVRLLGFTFAFMMIPLAYMILFMLIWLCRRSNCLKKCAESRAQLRFQKFRASYSKDSEAYTEEEDTKHTVTYSEVPADDIPDRLANSFRYRSLSLKSVVPETNDKVSD